MTFLRRLVKGLLSILGKFEPEDACALLCAAEVNIFELDKLLPENVETEAALAEQSGSVLIALSLEAESARLSWRSYGLSSSFLWKREADLGVRDWVYLLS